MFELLKVKKSIYKIISTLMSANKKVSYKKRALPNLSFTWKLAKIIPKVLRVEQFIFQALILIWQTLRRSFDVYADIIALTSLSELIKAQILSFLNQIR